MQTSSRLCEVLAVQSQELERLKRMVLGLGCFILLISACGFVLFDVYLLSNLSEERMGFLNRTLSYLQTSLDAIMTLRNMELISNFANVSVGIDMDGARRSLIDIAATMSAVHSLNYISPPTQRVADFFNQKIWTEQMVVGGQVGFEFMQVSFWDLMNDFISAIRTSSQISISTLKNSDYSLDDMNVQKRAIAFM